jgi:hypothetical protein
MKRLGEQATFVSTVAKKLMRGRMLEQPLHPKCFMTVC